MGADRDGADRDACEARGGLTRIELTLRTDNLPAIAIDRKAGLRIEGC